MLKIPKTLNTLTLIRKNSTNAIRQEIRDAEELVTGTGVVVPRTEVHRISGSYIMRQDWIDEDQSVPDVEGYLKAQGLETLVDEYRHEPLNFVAKEGVVYWVDPTKGVLGRVFDRIPIPFVSLKTWRKTRKAISKPIRLLERVTHVYKHEKV